jgi:hypothetical protein
MSKTIIFIADTKKSVVQYFNDQGYIVGLFADLNLKEKLEDQEFINLFDFVFPVNFTTAENIKKSFKDIRFRKNTLLFCTKDKYTVASGIIAEVLDLDQKKFLNSEVTRLTTSKILQRRQFEKYYPEISPKFKVVRNFHSAYTFTRKLGFPVITKPSSLSQSRLVYIHNNLEELVKNVSYSLDHIAEIYQANNVYKKPALLIETFIKGKLYSVDSYISQEGKITHTPPCREYTANEMGKNGFNLLYAGYLGDVTKEEEKIIFETVEKAIKSIGVKGNVVHTEVKIENEKCQVIETQLRGGGFRNVILDLAFGIDHNQNIINCLLNKEVDARLKKQEYAGYVKIIPEKIGILKSINGLEKIQQVESLHKINISKSAKVGNLIGPNEKGFEIPIVIILHNKNKEQIEIDAKKILETVKLDIEETEQEENFETR